MNIAIIGAGGIGKKRAENLPAGIDLKIVCDIDKIRGQKLADENHCGFVKDWKKVVTDKEIDAVIVCTTHNWLAKIAIAAIKNGKHVLIEKPGAISFKEMDEMIKVQKGKNVVVSFGYNHRYHPAIIKSKEIVKSEKLGEVMFIRARYGHGARLNYDQEWRFDKKLSGGGELIDQGPHLIDLVNYFVGPMNEVLGKTMTFYWKTKLEDSAFLILQNKKGQLAQLSVTCVERMNIFSFEIMFEKGKVQIDGLGRSYGEETLTLYKMKPEMGPPDIEIFRYPEEDDSWRKDNAVFFERIRVKDFRNDRMIENKYVLKTIEKVYKLNK